MTDGPGLADADRSGTGPPRPREDVRVEGPLERADRNMVEMLQELRVAQTGVQILFAFLLSLSFTERFGRIDPTQRWIYVGTLLLTTLTTGLLVAPAAVHRILFGRGVKAEVVRIGQRLFVAGLLALAATLVGAVLLVLDVAVGRRLAVPMTAGVALVLLALWFLLPLVALRRSRSGDGGEHDGGGHDSGEHDSGEHGDGGHGVAHHGHGAASPRGGGPVA